jgi:methyl-accepting chemotaxis protein
LLLKSSHGKGDVMARHFTADVVLGTLILVLLAAVAAMGAVGQAALAAAQAPPELLARAQWLAGGIFAAAVAASLVLRAAIRKAAQRPIRAATQVVERVAEGDLTVSAEGMDQVHTRRLMKALQGMTSVLHVIVSEVVQGARAIAGRSGELARGHRDLARRTEEEACALQQTASSLEELTATVAQNADSARKASAFAAGAREVACSGGNQMGDLVATMTGIAESSRRINDIVATIDGIAFQTNILALNAAVEAARAGEGGRGFAVVASEVRALAQRSAAAAREIKALIAASAARVETGATLVETTGRTMTEIVGSITRVSELIADIAQASAEQSDGLAQVNTAVARMEHVAQQNAALADAANVATQEMDRHAENLLGLVSRFHVAHGSAHPPAPAAASAAAPEPEPMRSPPTLRLVA